MNCPECGKHLENIGGIMLCPECDIVEDMNKTLEDDKWVQERKDENSNS